MKTLTVALLVLVSLSSGQHRLEVLRQGLRESLEPSGKCGTPLVFDATRRIQEFPPLIQMSIREVLQRPQTHRSRLSPSGRFRIHYDTTGVNQPAMLAGDTIIVPNSFEEYIDSVASIFDQCYVEEITVLGFEPPPTDGGTGGGTEYDVYVQDQQPGTFGFTSWVGETQYESGIHTRFASYVEIDNDYLNYRTPGIRGLRVTAAHEYQHAIQIGSYGIWTNVTNSDFYFYELTSVWLEDVVFNDVNDYYFDLSLFLNSFKDGLKRSFSFVTFTGAYAGYERSLWGHFLEQRFDRGIVREIWDGMKRMPALRSMDEVLRRRGTDLASAFTEFASWNLFTGYRADTVRSYREGSNYPALTSNLTTQFNGSATSLQSAGHPLSAQYYEFGLSGDTLVAVVTNTELNEAYENPSALGSITLTVSNSRVSGATQRLSNGLIMGFNVERSESWRTLYLSTDSKRDLRGQSQPAPNPLRIREAAIFVLPADGSQPGPAEIYIVSSSFDLVFSGHYMVVDLLGKSVVNVPSRDLADRVSSGVHFVVLKTKEREYQWKVAILR